MLNLLIRYAIAGACVLFMVSLPLGKMEVAGRLRRTSGALMLLAFAPYVFVAGLLLILGAAGQAAITWAQRVGGIGYATVLIVPAAVCAATVSAGDDSPPDPVPFAGLSFAAAALAHEQPARVTAEDGLAALQIAIAAGESARTGRAVRLAPLPEVQP